MRVSHHVVEPRPVEHGGVAVPALRACAGREREGEEEEEEEEE